MATKKATTTVEETESTMETVQKKETQPKFTVERLAVDCRKLFGVSSCTYAGATSGLTGEYTVAEMKKHIDKWCKMEVK